MPGVRVESLTTLDAFDALAGGWDELVAAMPRPSPFLLHGWLRAIWPLGERPRIAVAHRDGRLVGALPLDVRRRRGLRVAEFLGGMDAHLADVLLAPGEEDELTDTLVAEAVRGGIDLADFFGMPGGSRIGRVRGLRLLERVEAPVLDLDGGWTDVYARVASGKSRQTHRRKLRRLGELGRLEFSLATTAEEVDPALEETFRLHALRWRGRPDGSGLRRAEVQEAHRAGYRSLAGTARILTLALDGRPIAYNCFLVLGGRLYSHRLGFDPAYARWSPGLLCTLELCERAAAQGVERIEFLGGAEDYKLQLADRLEPLLEGLGLAGTIRGRAVVAARLGTVVARRRLKRFRRLRRFYVEGLSPFRRAIASVYAPR